MRFRKYDISREDVLNNTKDLVPEEFDGRYRYYVELHGKKYPAKQAVQSATGLAKSEFISMDATRILKKLGFNVRDVAVACDAGTGEQVRDPYQSSGTYRFAITLVPRLPVLSGDDFVKIMRRLGYETDHISGSHMILMNSGGLRLNSQAQGTR